ncbi:MAG: ATP-binding protein [Terracidiphilus sp.]
MKGATSWIAEDRQALLIPGGNWGITEHTQSADNLRTSVDRVRQALEAGRIGTFDWDSTCNRLISSRMYDELWGSRPEEFSGVNEAFLERAHPEDLPDITAELNLCIASQKPLASEFRVIWPDGSVHWLLLRGEFTFDDDGHPLQLRGVAMDIGERKQHEETLQKAAHTAEASNRSKSEFFAHVSHEIRTPLTAIMGMTYLAMRTSPSPPLERYLTKIGNAAQSLLGITNDILDFSKIEAGKLELEHIPFLLDDVINGVSDIVAQRAAQKGLALVFSVARETPRYLVGDPLRLGQILVNLINNAVKFTEKGEIVVKLTVSDVTGDKGLFKFSVSDTGIGMTPEQLVNVFHSFKQADASISRRYGGTGLGLVVCKQLCDLMNADLFVESEPGRGSTFVFKANLAIATGAGLQ